MFLIVAAAGTLDTSKSGWRGDFLPYLLSLSSLSLALVCHVSHVALLIGVVPAWPRPISGREADPLSLPRWSYLAQISDRGLGAAPIIIVTRLVFLPAAAAWKTR